MSNLNEFRQDLVSGDWVLFSTGLVNKPVEREVEQVFYQPKEGCPFENPQPDQGQPLLVYLNGNKLELDGDFRGDWTTQVIKNKYPVLSYGACTPVIERGPFKVSGPYGYHELVITKDHDLSFSGFSVGQTAEVITAYKERFIEISKDDCVVYISILHNHGRKSGASRYHNHSQIFGTPIVPPHIIGSLNGAKEYYQTTGEKVHAVLLEWASKEKKSIVYENDGFVALCPFASKTPYQVRIFPKVSSPRFEEISEQDVFLLADVLNTVIKKINVVLAKPDYNFYIHTAPVSKDSASDYDYYHWHFEIIPRLSTAGGFELGTSIYINPVDPDFAAEQLRNAKV